MSDFGIDVNPGFAGEDSKNRIGPAIGGESLGDRRGSLRLRNEHHRAEQPAKR